MNDPIPYTRPSITQLEIDLATDAAAHGWGDDCYQYLDRFEREFARRVDSSWSVATSSGTGALHLGLAALGIGTGDEVILADSNWIATVSPIVHLGAKPVFVDIQPDTWCIDPNLAELAITRRTRAIVATHLYGNVCDLDRLSEICRRNGLYLIEDAAEALGASYRGRHVGSIGEIGAFSFHGTKTITTGEGGALVTSNPMIRDAVRALNNHGREPDERRSFWSARVGYKFRMSNIQAAIGCGQLARWRELTMRKRWILEQYRQRLELPGVIALNETSRHSVQAGWMPTAVFSEDSDVSREDLLKAFREAGIDGRPFFWPLRSMPMFTSLGPPGAIAQRIASHAINLPSFHDISQEEIDRVVAAVLKVWRNQQ